MTILAAVLMTVSATAAPKHYELKSPDGNLVVSIEAGEGINYSLTHGQDLLLDKANISMITVEGDVFGGVQPVKKVTRRSVSETITPVIYTKDVVKDEFNELTLKFKQFSVVFRAYDEGMAYRFISHLKGDYHVEYEMAEFNFAQDWNMWAAYVAQHTETLESQFYNSFENRYSYTLLSQWDQTRMAFLPLLVDGPNGKKIAITEADLLNYPGMYLYNDKLDGEQDSALEARFAGYPDEVRQGGHNNLQMEVQSRHPYIAKCSGEQAFPWRVISVSTEDIQMADNDILFDKNFRRQVRDYMKSRGYKVIAYGEGIHDTYQKSPVFNFELHIGLVPGYVKPSWSTYYANIRERLLKDAGNDYGYHFSDEDFYIYFIAHAFKHFENSGTGIRNLADIYIFLHSRARPSRKVWHI